MILDRVYTACLSHASYFLACQESKQAVVIDPRRDTEVYLEMAKEYDVKIEWILLTHFHADFISGHLELAEATGAKIGLSQKAKSEYPHESLKDGQVLDFGGFTLEVLETPGHTPESACFVLHTGDTDVPQVFSGDTLFVGSVGRPDLLASFGVTETELATCLFHSLRDKLFQLPGETIVWPAHGAGSACGKSLGDAPSTTIADERSRLSDLMGDDPQPFIDEVTQEQPDAPKYFSHDAVLNRKARPLLEDILAQADHAFSPAEFLEAPEGCQYLDVRKPEAYCQRHLKQALWVGLDGRFATWAGAILDVQKPIRLIVEPERAREALERLARVGLDMLQGYLAGGSAGLEKISDELCGQHQRVSAETLKAQCEAQVLDVRAESERRQGAIPHSTHIVLNDLEERYQELNQLEPWVVHCAGGYRSLVASSLLRTHGLEVKDLIGGYGAWAQLEGKEGGSCSLQPGG